MAQAMKGRLIKARAGAIGRAFLLRRRLEFQPGRIEEEAKGWLARLRSRRPCVVLRAHLFCHQLPVICTLNRRMWLNAEGFSKNYWISSWEEILTQTSSTLGVNEFKSSLAVNSKDRSYCKGEDIAKGRPRGQSCRPSTNVDLSKSQATSHLLTVCYCGIQVHRHEINARVETGHHKSRAFQEVPSGPSEGSRS